ncbi:MAG: disulfide reductase [Chloroflexi bacterium]|nr:disulfide reductase [Chloroflexota bacterium]
MTKKTYAYYPGCSLQHGNHAYGVSTEAVARQLDIELVEIDDWNCCGATEYMSINRLPAYALIARNLARAANENGEHDLVVPCSACFLNLHKTDKQMKEFPEWSEKINRSLAAGNLQYEPGTIKVRHWLEAITTDFGSDNLKTRVKRPLYGLKLAPYYGCLVARPDSVFDSTEQPTVMDDMLAALGAEVTTDFSLKTFCCGGHMTQISEETALGMIHQIIHNAVQAGADAIVTLCPMCQLNLDVYQGYANNLFETDYEMPIMFFTQVIGLAMGLSPKELGVGQEFVSMQPAIKKIQDVPPPKPKSERRPKQALPMPVMPE